MRPAAAEAQRVLDEQPSSTATFNPVPSPALSHVDTPPVPVDEALASLALTDSGASQFIPLLPPGAALTIPIVSASLDEPSPRAMVEGATIRSATMAAALATEPPINNDMNLVVGGVLVPTQESSPPSRRATPKPNPGLRLPSFEALGIAAPHPDRLASNLSLDGCLCTTMTADEDLSVHGRAPNVNMSSLEALGEHYRLVGAQSPAPNLAQKRTLRPAVHHEIDVLTPPAEAGDDSYGLQPQVVSTSMDSPFTDPGQPSLPSESTGESAPMPVVEAIVPAVASAMELQSSGPMSAAQFEFLHAPKWVQPALAKLCKDDLFCLVRYEMANSNAVKIVQDAPLPAGEALKVLSHALPSPSPNGHVFSRLINDIHMAPLASRTEWINVLHAIPGEYNLQSLPPTSPPPTPGDAIGGDDYFTKKVFDNAVTILDYQSDLALHGPSPHRAVASPSSIHVAIVERYIPPTNANEFTDIFSPDGPSILVDRLVELSPHGGTLLFIYPHRAGAASFHANQLEPIKAPALRSLATQYNVSTTIGEPLARLERIVLDSLPTHEVLVDSTTELCARLTAESASLRNFRHKPAAFSLVHAEAATVPSIPSQVWLSDWWARQEKRKLQAAMRDFAVRAAEAQTRDLASQLAIAASGALPPRNESFLLKCLLADMSRRAEKREAAGDDGAGEGISVSVLVIQRTA